jgi:putative hydrolase
MFSGAGNVMTGGTQSGPVNYDLARQLASSSIGFVAPVPEKTSSAIADAVHLAETWLDGVTALPAGTTKAVAWTPNDWIDNTMDTWKRLCDPVAEQISTVWASALPEEARSMAGPLLSMMTQMGGMAFGSQLGQALGKLSREVFTSTDIGLPLGPKGVAALMPDAIESLSEGLEQPRSEILTFLAAREAAPSAVQPYSVACQPAAGAVEASPGHEDRHEAYRGSRGLTRVVDHPSEMGSC